MTEKMLDWCIAELKAKAKAFQENGGLVSVFDGDVVKSDTTIPPDLQAALKVAVEPLRTYPNISRTGIPVLTMWSLTL